MNKLRNIDQILPARIQTQIFLTFRSTVHVVVIKMKYKEIIKKKKTSVSVHCVPGTELYVLHRISYITLTILPYLFYC